MKQRLTSGPFCLRRVKEIKEPADPGANKNIIKEKSKQQQNYTGKSQVVSIKPHSLLFHVHKTPKSFHFPYIIHNLKTVFS